MTQLLPFGIRDATAAGLDSRLPNGGSHSTTSIELVLQGTDSVFAKAMSTGRARPFVWRRTLRPGCAAKRAGLLALVSAKGEKHGELQAVSIGIVLAKEIDINITLLLFRIYLRSHRIEDNVARLQVCNVGQAIRQRVGKRRLPAHGQVAVLETNWRESQRCPERVVADVTWISICGLARSAFHPKRAPMCFQTSQQPIKKKDF